MTQIVDGAPLAPDARRLAEAEVLEYDAADADLRARHGQPVNPQRRRARVPTLQELAHDIAAQARAANDARLRREQEQWEAVREADLDNGLTWGEPAALNNTYAMAVRSEYAQANDLAGKRRKSDVLNRPNRAIPLADVVNGDHERRAQ